MAEDWGYDEVNLNVGCPSDRVQNNKIGACLMAEPDLVAECIHSMQKAVNIPVTVKHRIGIDDMQSYEEMLHFVDTVAATGCTLCRPCPYCDIKRFISEGKPRSTTATL